MRQVLQELATGNTVLAEVPEPALRPGCVRIVTSCSLISAGTERMLVEFARAGWIERARQQPERVAQVVEKVRSDGLAATLEAVRSRLEQPVALGYSNVGVVEQVDDAPGFARGDRVVSNGPHAEVVTVARNLCAHIPASVSDEAAAFAVVGAVGLQGVRLAAPTLGESFLVSGLGLIGLMTVQLLRANGCRVLGVDPDPRRTELAREMGAQTVELSSGESPLLAAADFTHGQGADGVLITAASQSDELVSQAARVCRKRGRIVLVGVAGLKLRRSDFYEKELSLQVSCSYGPGRYDPQYEEGGHDYPLGFVRWTEQRNIAAVLELMASSRLDPRPLISHRFALSDASRAYNLLVHGGEPCLGALLEYPRREPEAPAIQTLALAPARMPQAGAPSLAVIGAGNHLARVLIPALARTGARLYGVADRGGVRAAQVGRKYGFALATTDVSGLLQSSEVNAVVIGTRHDSHAALAQQALQAGKHVFVEKPLALTMAQLAALEAAWGGGASRQRPLLMVGFNRRFAPHAVRMRQLLATVPGPKAIVVTVNAGALPAEHWTLDETVGGGRLIGEGCHFIDLLRFLIAAPIERWDVTPASSAGDGAVTVTLSFVGGSIGTLHYFANGHPSLPKERVEAFAARRVLRLDNFRTLRAYGWPGFRLMRLWRQDKGHDACAAAFVNAIRVGGDPPIPVAELFEVARATIGIGEAARR